MARDQTLAVAVQTLVPADETVLGAFPAVAVVPPGVEVLGIVLGAPVLLITGSTMGYIAIAVAWWVGASAFRRRPTIALTDRNTLVIERALWWRSNSTTTVRRLPAEALRAAGGESFVSGVVLNGRRHWVMFDAQVEASRLTRAAAGQPR